MTTSSERDRELRAIGLSLATLRLDLSLIRLGRALERRFNPDQPRWPAGGSDGGRWSGGAGGTAGRLVLSDSVLADGTSIASAVNHGDRDYDWDERHVVVTPDGASTVFETKDLTQTIRDGGTGEILSRSTWGPNGPEPDAVLQSVRRLVPPPTTPTIGNPLAPALQLYNEFSQRMSRVARILALGVNASEYRQGTEATQSVWVGYVTESEAEDACHKYGKVQELTDEAVDKVKRDEAYFGPADYGTKVHLELKRLIESKPELNLGAEVSISKSEAEGDVYGRLGTKRIDVLENAGKATVCVYDIKTGKSGLSATRMSELAETIQVRYPGTLRTIVIETRPSR